MLYCAHLTPFNRGIHSGGEDGKRKEFPNKIAPNYIRQSCLNSSRCLDISCALQTNCKNMFWVYWNDVLLLVKKIHFFWEGFFVLTKHPPQVCPKDKLFHFFYLSITKICRLGIGKAVFMKEKASGFIILHH